MTFLLVNTTSQVLIDGIQYIALSVHRSENVDPLDQSETSDL